MGLHGPQTPGNLRCELQLHSAVQSSSLRDWWVPLISPDKSESDPISTTDCFQYLFEHKSPCSGQPAGSHQWRSVRDPDTQKLDSHWTDWLVLSVPHWPVQTEPSQMCLRYNQEELQTVWFTYSHKCIYIYLWRLHTPQLHIESKFGWLLLRLY